MSFSNRALCVCGIDKLAIDDWPLEIEFHQGKPIVPEGKVLVRVRATGICGSDIYFWKTGRVGNDIVNKPFVIGHECAGEVVDVGANVENWNKNDAVVIKPAASCLKCVDCTTGHSNLCSETRHFGVPGCDGSCSTFKIVPTDQLVCLSPKISWTEAGVIQPLAISLHMAHRAGLKAHQNVIIIGGGCIGLLLGAIARVYGAAKVVILEKEAHRAEFAKNYCADQVFINPPRISSTESTESHSDLISKHILDNVEGLYRGFDVCFEASGKEECMQIGMKVCRPGGTYLQVGNYNPAQHPQIPMSIISTKELTVRGTWTYSTNCFENAVELVDQGLIDVKALVSHTYDFDDSLEAFEAVHKMRDRKGNSVLKTVILLGHDKTNGTEGEEGRS